LKSSKVAVKRWCGTDNVSYPEIRELVIERSRYVYNDSLEFFNDNFQSELMAVSLANYEEGADGEDEVPETQSQ
jgi:hypothetical protein